MSALGAEMGSSGVHIVTCIFHRPSGGLTCRSQAGDINVQSRKQILADFLSFCYP